MYVVNLKFASREMFLLHVCSFLFAMAGALLTVAHFFSVKSRLSFFILVCGNAVTTSVSYEILRMCFLLVARRSKCTRSAHIGYLVLHASFSVWHVSPTSSGS